VQKLAKDAREAPATKVLLARLAELKVPVTKEEQAAFRLYALVASAAASIKTKPKADNTIENKDFYRANQRALTGIRSTLPRLKKDHAESPYTAAALALVKPYGIE